MRRTRWRHRRWCRTRCGHGWAVEDVEPARVSLVLALTQLAVERSETPVGVAWVEQLWTGEDHPVDLRFAGALAWLCATVAPPSPSLLDLLATATTPAMRRWMRQVPWPDDVVRHGGLAAWLTAFLGTAPEGELEDSFEGRNAAIVHHRVPVSAVRSVRSKTSQRPIM